MKIPQILTAVVVILFNSALAIAPASAQAQISREDLPFARQMERFYSLLNLDSPYPGTLPEVEADLIKVQAEMARIACSLLREGLSLQTYKDMFDKEVAEGDGEGAILTLAIISSAVTVYCPEFADDVTETFRQN